MKCSLVIIFANRKRYVKSLRIRHTYGEEDETEMLEEEAMRHAERAIQNGDTPEGPNIPTEAVAAPENAVVSISGKACKWCGSKTHSRRSHKDCPYNPKKSTS